MTVKLCCHCSEPLASRQPGRQKMQMPALFAHKSGRCKRVPCIFPRRVDQVEPLQCHLQLDLSLFSWYMPSLSQQKPSLFFLAGLGLFGTRHHDMLAWQSDGLFVGIAVIDLDLHHATDRKTNRTRTRTRRSAVQTGRCLYACVMLDAKPSKMMAARSLPRARCRTQTIPLTFSNDCTFSRIFAV